MQAQTETTSQRKTQSQNQSQGQSHGQSQNGSRSAAKSESSATEDKSVTAIIGESLDKDTKKQIDEVLKQASEYYSQGKSYVSANRGEALILAAAFGVAAWALLYTKPGRQLLEVAAPKIVPQISNLLTETMGAAKA